MSGAPIDDLLYDDSGDEDMDVSSAAPMTSLASAVPLSAPPAAIAFPLPNATTTAGPSAVAATGGTTAASPATTATSTTAALRQPVTPTPGLLAASTTSIAAPSSITSSTTAPPTVAAKTMTMKQAPGSGQQMFKQMFALLRQMLPAEQYATLHSELGNGNGNDIKSIVDIIKRIAGDAIFSSVIQKMDLTRTFPTTPQPHLHGLKQETTPASSALPGAVSTPNASPLHPPAAIAAPPGIASAPPAAAIAPPTGTHRPAVSSSIASTVKPSVATPSSAPIKQETAAAATVSANASSSTPATTPQASSNATSSTAGTSGPGTTADSSKKQEAMEKIEFAKKLLFHASTCVLPPGTCQVKKCDDVRRVFKHSASCGGNKACQHCEQLKGLVKYHAKECLIASADHCAIPFCDGLRRAYQNAAAAAKAKAAAQAAAAAAAEANKVNGATEDEDKTKRVLKTKASLDAGKKPATTAAAAATTPRSVVAPSATTATSSTTTTPAPAAAAAATTASTQGAKPKPGVNANVAAEYGRLLQLILHVQKCTSTTCPVGEECAEAKSLLRQINSPNAPARAKTYKQVYAHYKVCLQKNNTANCAMCKIGLRPIVPGSSASSTPIAATPSAQVTASTSSTAATTGTSTTASTTASASTSSSTDVPTTTTTSKRPAIGHPSPTKKQKTSSTPRTKTSTGPGDSGGSNVNIGGSSSSDQPSGELLQASVGDIRKEADVLTHTNIELGVERRNMMEGVLKRKIPEQLTCVKEKWAEVDLFNTLALRRQMEQIGQRNGVQMGLHTTEIMSFALQEYLKQAIEEMVEIAKQRGDLYAQQRKELRPAVSSANGSGDATANRKENGVSRPKTTELLATDILRVSCEDSFAKMRTEDLALRARLLEEALKEESAEKERAKKRKKADRSKVQQEEKLDKELDIEELAVKDLKERLLQDEHAGVARIEGRLNESIHGRFARRSDSQVTMEDASFWLQSQKPYVNPKLFVRAEIARLLTNAYQ